MEKKVYEIIYSAKGEIIDFRLMDTNIEILQSKYYENSPHCIYFLYADSKAYERNEYRILFEGQVLISYSKK